MAETISNLPVCSPTDENISRCDPSSNPNQNEEASFGESYNFGHLTFHTCHDGSARTLSEEEISTMTQYEDALGDPVSPVGSTSAESVFVITKLTRFNLM